MKYSLPNYADVKGDLPSGPLGADPDVAYESGYVGAYFDPHEYDVMRDTMTREGLPFRMSDVAHEYGFAGQAKEGVYLLYKEIEALGLPLRTISRVSQPVGNCVSRGTQNALYHLLCVDVRHGHGTLPPGIHEAAKNCNPISSEVNYWWKWPGSRPGSDGWYAGACLRAAKEHGGVLVRRDFRDIGGPDLRTETKQTAHAYAAASVPEAIKREMHQHPLQAYAECESFEEVADAIASGYPVQTDGGEGWAKSVDEHGVAHKQGSWSHSMCVTGIITTPEFKARYNTAGGLVIQNSWGAYFKNDHARIMGTSQGLPDGAFVALWDDCKHRSFYAVSSLKGWPPRRMPSWRMADLI